MCTGRNWQTCDTMNFAEMPENGASFALSVSDVTFGTTMTERLDWIGELSSRFGSLRAVCVRNDSMDPDLFAMAASAAVNTGLPVILESCDPVCLREAAMTIRETSPLLCMTDPSALAETSLLSAVIGCPVAVPGADIETLMENVESAESMGATGIVLNPMVRNMKTCLELNTDLHRLRVERSFPPACHPIMTRAWSGEYALSMASVSVMRHGSLIVLDDLDEGCCEILDRIIVGCI